MTTQDRRRDKGNRSRFKVQKFKVRSDKTQGAKAGVRIGREA